MHHEIEIDLTKSRLTRAWIRDSELNRNRRRDLEYLRSAARRCMVEDEGEGDGDQGC